MYQSGGRREYVRIDANWPYPPPGRARFVHQRLTEEHHGELGVTYRTYADGTVVAYGRAPFDVTRNESDDVARTRAEPHHDWVAVVWTRHPLLNPRGARQVRYLADRATYAEVLAAVDKWELEGDV